MWTPFFFSRVLQRAGNALLREVNNYDGLACFAIDLDELQGVRVAATVVRSWGPKGAGLLSPQYAGLER